MWAGGYTTTTVNTIDYVTIASTGNATDFGDLTTVRRYVASASSETRGVFAGGQDDASTLSNVMEYVTIASTGNATDFGDLVRTNSGFAGCSNAHGGL